MAETPADISVLLHQIADATIYDRFADRVDKDQLKTVQALAGFLAERGAETCFPQSFSGPNYINFKLNEQRYYENRSDSPDLKLENRFAFAREMTLALAGLLLQLGDNSTTDDLANRNIRMFSATSEAFVDVWGYLIPFILAKGQAKFTDEVDKSRMFLRTALEEATAVIRDMRTLASAAKESAESVAASSHAQEFDRLSGKYTTLAIASFGGTVLIAALFFGAVVYYLDEMLSISKAGLGDKLYAFQVIVSRVLVLAVIYYLMLLVARIFRAFAHLAAVSRHRATALNTLTTFVQSAGDQQTKDAVLLETTRCIYSHTSTGFLGGSEDSTAPLQIVEIMKAFGQQPK